MVIPLEKRDDSWARTAAHSFAKSGKSTASSPTAWSTGSLIAFSTLPIGFSLPCCTTRHSRIAACVSGSMLLIAFTAFSWGGNAKRARAAKCPRRRRGTPRAPPPRRPAIADRQAHFCYTRCMDAGITIDPILRSFREALSELYGPVLDRVVLFGSRARGEAREDSDYDVAVFLKEIPNRRAEWDRLAHLRLRFLDGGGPFFEAIPFRASDWDGRTPLMHEIRRDGLIL
jgi:predicted nucleotidyltransferase